MAVDFTSLGGERVLYQTLKDNPNVQKSILVAKSFETVQKTIDDLGIKYSKEQLDYFKEKIEAKLG